MNDFATSDFTPYEWVTFFFVLVCCVGFLYVIGDE